MLKKSLSVFLAVIMLFGVFNILPLNTAALETEIAQEAAEPDIADAGADELAMTGVDLALAETGAPSEEQFVNSINSLQQTFVNGQYWNKASSADYSRTGNVPCDGISYSSAHYGMRCSAVGYCDYCSCECGYFAGGYQCVGFAYKMASLSLGTYPGNAGWVKSYSLGTVCAGDIIRIRNDTHTIFVYKVIGDTIYFADCNWSGPCQVRWGATYSYSALSSVLSYKWHLDGNSLTGNYNPVTYANMDVNFWVDGRDQVSIDGIGYIQVYVDGQLQGSGTDFCQNVVAGKGYEIRVNITNSDYHFGGVDTTDGSGQTGTTAAGGTKVRLVIVKDSGGTSGIADGDYQIVSVLNNSYGLDIAGDNLPCANQENLELWTTGDIPRMQDCFTLTGLGNGYYSIQQMDTNMAVDVFGANTNRTGNISMYEGNGSVAQQWKISYDSSIGGYTIQAKCSGMFMTVEGGAMTSGTNIYQNIKSIIPKAQGWLLKRITKLTKDMVTVSGWSVADDGQHMPELTVTEVLEGDSEKTLVKGEDYTVAVERYPNTESDSGSGLISVTDPYREIDPENPSEPDYTYRAVVTGIGSYCGSVTVYERTPLDNDMILITGMIKTDVCSVPEFKIVDGDYELIRGVDYISRTIYRIPRSWVGGTPPKTYKEKVIGIGNYYGTIYLDCEKAVSGNVSGTVTSYLDESETIYVNLYSNGFVSLNPTYSTEVIGNNANYFIADVAPGKYKMIVRKSQHLSFQKDIVVNGDTTIDVVLEIENQPGTEPDESALIGDADGDGEVSSIDATVLQRYCADLQTGIDESVLMNGDIDGNGYLEIIDVTFIRRWLAQMEIPFAIGEMKK